MTLPADAASAVNVSLQVTDITDDQLAADNGNGDGCGKPTSTQGADWAPTTFPGTLATGSLEVTTDSLALDGSANPVRALREARHPHLYDHGAML